MNEHVRAAQEREVNDAWWQRYRWARQNGFSPADADLHATQEAQRVRKEQQDGAQR